MKGKKWLKTMEKVEFSADNPKKIHADFSNFVHKLT